MTDSFNCVTEHLFWVTKYMLESGLIGRNTRVNIDGKEYYVKVEIAEIKKCKECGKEL